MRDRLGIQQLVLRPLSARPRPHRRRTGTFFCVITTQLSSPRIATAVCPAPEMALKAYSTWYSRPSGEKTVSWAA